MYMAGSETSEQYKSLFSLNINNFIFHYLYPPTLSK